MMRASRFLLASVALGLLVAPAIAKTWFVGGPGADFDEIQPAIDAAQDGDVILVRPGQYHGFLLSKGVMVAASSAPFSVPPTATDRVVVSGVAAGRRAGIAGLSMSGLADMAGYQFLEVSSCPGEVVLEDLDLSSPDSIVLLSADLLLIADCTNVSVTALQVSRGSDASRRGAVRVERSVVRLADLAVQSGKQLACEPNLDGSEGAPAVELLDSSVVVAGEATLRAGHGANGCMVFHSGGSGGEGGDAVKAVNSTVFLIGREVAGSRPFELRGGNGGDSAIEPFSGMYLGNGGDGGEGFSGAEAVTSMIRFTPGTGGDGSTPGDGGLPWEGDLTELDTLPFFALSGDLHPGSAFTLTLQTVDPGSVILVFADHQGTLPIFGNPGPPLGAVPGGRFLTFFAGHLGAQAQLTIPLTLPGDPGLRGVGLHAQAAVLLDAGGFVLTNAASRVVRE